MDLDKLIKESIKETLEENGFSSSSKKKESINEAYVIQPGKFDLNTQLLSDKTKNHMGMRATRFVMVVNNNEVQKLFIEDPGEYRISSAENLLNNL